MDGFTHNSTGREEIHPYWHTLRSESNTPKRKYISQE